MPQLTRATASPCRRSYCGARSEPCRAAGGLLPMLLAAADLAPGGVRTLPDPRLRGSVFLRVA